MGTMTENLAKMTELIFYVNGKKITETNPPPTTLLAEYLRYNLKLTGTKVACGEGGCGSCTVMVSWFNRSASKIVHYAVNACIVPICSLHGLAITTVEALGSTKTKLHELQERLVAGHGIQCGYCTPGMLMAMYALLRSNNAPTELQIEHALKGNLCRCTGYRPILDSFRSFSKASVCPMGEHCCKNQPKDNSCSEAVCSSAADDFNPHKQELIFPSELQLSDCYDKQSLKFTSDAVTWYRPVSMNELLDLMKQFPGALLIAGGTNAVFKLKFSTPEKPLVVIATTQIRELHSFEEREGGLWIGAMTSMTSLENKIALLMEKLPETKTRLLNSLLDVLQCFGYPQIRNRATIGGSLATASTLADVNVLLLTTGSRVKLASADGEREVHIQQNFFTGKSKTCLKPDELILGLFVPFSAENEYFESFKQSARKDLTLADVNAGMHVEFEEGSDVVKVADLVFGGLTAVPVVVEKTAKTLIGRKWDSRLLEELTSSLANEFRPILSSGDSDKYKLAVAQGFAFKFFLKVYNKHFHKLDLLSLTKEEEHYITSTQAALHRTHSGTQVYDIVTKQSEADTIGQPLTNRWAKQSATGEAVFIDDMRPAQGELHLALVSSTKANAKIVSVDPSAALAMQGVVCFLDHKSTIKSNFTGMSKEEIFASEEVHWVGQTIGAVVAESLDQARRAARAVVVQYEEFEPIISIEDAISKKSFHPWHGDAGVVNYGDVKSAFATCDHVIEGEVRVGGQEHFYMETQGVRVVPKGEDGELDIYVGVQYGTGLQLSVASALDVSCNKIIVHTKRMGGSFGGKEFRLFIITMPSAIAAHKLNRPVRCVLDRRQDMQITGIRRPYLAKYKVGFNKDGKVLALDLDMYSNDGYCPDLGHAFMGQSILYADNCYAIPNISVRGHLCKTNLPPNTAMRGAGVPQSILICEHWLTKVADFLKQPSHKIRELNMYHEGYVTFINVPVEGSLRRCFEEVLKQSDYERYSEEIKKFNSQSSLLKKGIAIVPVKHSPGLPPGWTYAGALVNVYLDGSVLLYHGGVESGQGLHTKMIQVASRALDICVEKIHISETSNAVIPNSVTTGGSGSADLNGAAVLNACNILNERLKPVKEANPNGKWEEWITAAYNQKINLSASGFFNLSSNENYDWKTGKGRPHGYYTYGVAVTQVEIDCLTGSYTIPKVDIVMDVGKSLNPAIDVGQIEGAFVMGIGLYALEEHRYGPDGHLETIGAGKYHIPTASSIPLQMNVSLLKDAGNPLAIYSSKGIGEPPLLLSCSVFFAIKDAISAARLQAGLPLEFILDSPATVQKIRLACGTDPPKLNQPVVKE